MPNGFPIRLLPLVRCTQDGAGLALRDGARAEGRILEGEVTCERCGTSFEIRDGILDLLGSREVADERSRFEMRSRDVEAATFFPPDAGYREEMEVPRTLDELGELSGKTVLEIGSGTGLYTRRLAAASDAVVAVDFSRTSLLANARWTGDVGTVAFVRANVSEMRLAAGAFDAALSTLYSNLPTPDIRAECNRRVVEGLKPGGRYVVSCHHQHLSRRLASLPARTRYEQTGVFAEFFTKQSFRSELLPFGQTRTSSICIWLPYASRFRRARPAISRMAERLPFLGAFGNLLLATVWRPKS